MISTLQRLGTTAVATTVAAAASITPVLAQNVGAQGAQTASEASMYQAGFNAGERLRSEGYELYDLEDAPYYVDFLEHGQSQMVSVNIPSTGNYLLLIGGDDDTVDLNLDFPQISGSDTTFGNTALIGFEVHTPGEFSYSIDMLNCQAENCGVYAVLLTL